MGSNFSTIRPHAVLVKTTTQAVPTGSTDVEVEFDEAREAQEGMHTAPETFLTAPTTGIYQLTGCVMFEDSSAGTIRMARFSINGSVTNRGRVLMPPTSATNSRMLCSTLYSLTEGDTVALAVQHNAGSDLDIEASNGAGFLSITMVGKA